MDKLITYKDSLALDHITQKEYLIPSLVLMEDAARLLYEEIKSELSKYKRVLFIAGCGNNGGDAIATARIAFCEGFRNIAIYFVNGKESEERKTERLIATKLGIPSTDELSADLIIDGLYGAGLKGDVREEGRALIEKINALSAFVVSIDTPSGLSEEGTSLSIIKANKTITFGYSKAAFYMPERRVFLGEIKVVNPSFAPVDIVPTALLLSDNDYSVAKLASNDYKNKRGSIAIVGGSKRYTGAVQLAAHSAFKAGAGLVTIYTSEDILPIIASQFPSAMLRSFKELKEYDSYDAILFGPGMGEGNEELLLSLLNNYSGKLVIDADGITCFTRVFKLGMTIKPNLIFTPHLGEVKRMLSSILPSSTDAFLASLDKLSAITNDSYIIAKYDVNLIVHHLVTPLVYDGSNPSLGVAGAGDILSGIVVTFASKDIPLYNAVILHQMAGKMAAKELQFYSSEELLPYIGRLR